MGTMTKMRENTGVILWILIIAFGVIWVLQDSGGLDVIGQVGSDVGSVNGESITYEEYTLAIDQQADNYQNQTGESMPPQMLDQTRDRVFNQLVDNKLRMQETRRLGLEVTDTELFEMVQGDNPHPYILANFGDGQGNIDRALLQNYIQNPDATEYWIWVDNVLRSDRLREKLDELITGTVRISDQDVIAAHVRRKRKVDVRYVAQRFTSLMDDEISYDDGDLRRFYNDHKDEFERNRSYSLSYVTRSKSATLADSMAILGDLEDMRESFASAEDDSLFLYRNGSERPYTDAYFRPDELDEPIADVVFADAEVGHVVGPIVSGNEAHILKILAVRPPEEQAVRASHILFRAAESNEDARGEALSKAQDALRRARNGENFAELARELSDDGSAGSGGDLGWFGPGRMVEPFEEAAFAATIGRVVGPIETQFGYHVIKVSDRATVEAQIADFALTLRASVATLRRVQEQLEDLQYYADETNDFSGEATRKNFNLLTVQVEAEQTFIPGIGVSRTLMNFLETAQVGDVSPVIELDSDFLVATVDEIQSAGYRPFEEVRAEIEPRLRNELKSSTLAERMQSALGNGIDGLADALDAPVQVAEQLSFNNMIVSGIGRDPIFVGTALGLEEGEISDVVTGQNAVYVILIDRVEEPGVLTDEARVALATQLLTQRQNLVKTQWIASLHDEADIIDNRRLFLQ